MNKTIGLQLIIYSLLLSGLSCLAHHLAPVLARPTLVAGLAGGLLCLIWGVRALSGNTGKALSLLTLIPINFVMLSQTVLAWGGGIQEAPGRTTAATLITLLFALSLGMLMRIAYAGAVFDEQVAGPTNAGSAQIRPPVKSSAASHAKR